MLARNMTVFEMQREHQNPIAKTDAYNNSHQFLKVNTDWETSHMYNRSKKQVLFLFSHIVAEHFSYPIATYHVEQYAIMSQEMGLVFPRELFERVVNEFNGYAPLIIQALPDGTICPAGTPFAQISNTHEGFGELVTWWEGVLMKGWFPSSCMTEVLAMYEYLLKTQEEFGYDDSYLWRFHSFGYRGHQTEQSALLAGLAWSMLLKGSDDIHIRQYMPKEIPMGSIAALAHKVTQQYDDELECLIHAVDAISHEFYVNGKGSPIVAEVIDTYDSYRVINKYLPQIANRAKEKGMKVTFRPDSGKVIQQAVDIYKQCQKHGIDNVSVIIGEGMSLEKAKKFDETLRSHGVPLNFVFYGIGAGYYHDLSRDYAGWAMKTAFSNGDNRMKFSEVEIKRSIAGEVAIHYNESRQMVVDYDLSDGLYQPLYMYTKGMDEPFMDVSSLSKTREILLSEIAWDNAVKQDRIILSDEVRAEMNRIAELHHVHKQ